MKQGLKNKIITIVIIGFVLGALIYSYSSATIFQEGNPLPQIKGIAQLIFGKSDMVKLSSSDNKYITRNKNGQNAIDSYLSNKGYHFTEQMGSGYFYTSSNDSFVVTRRQYSRFYAIWTFNKQ